MKKIIALLLAAVMLLAVVGCKEEKNQKGESNNQSTASETPASDFDYDIKNGAVMIKRYHGEAEDVIIPAYIEDTPVTVLSGTFTGSYGVRSVKIPDTVTLLYSLTFMGCKNLVSVDCGEGLKEITSETFKDCTSLEEIKLSPVLEKIGEQAFANCSSLKSVTFSGDAPKTVWGNAFGRPNKEFIIYYKEGTSGWDTTPLKDDYTLKAIE